MSMDTLEDFVRRYNAAQDVASRQNDKQKTEGQRALNEQKLTEKRARAIASAEAFIARLKRKRRQHKK
jgi:hypothetical protein